MSHVRLATPVRLVQLVIALAAVLAVMAVMSAPSFAGKKSESCSGIANCNTVIDAGDADVEVKSNRLLNDLEVLTVEDSFNHVLSNNVICIQLGLVNQCKSVIEIKVLNDLKALVGLTGIIYWVKVL